MFTSIVNRLQTTLVIYIGISPVVCFADVAKAPEIHYEFTQEETRYAVHASFNSPLSVSDTLEILLSHQHVKEFTKDIDTAHLDEQGDRWNRITYQQCEVFGCVESTYLRELDTNSGKLTFVQVGYQISGFFLPRVISSSGHYQVKAHADGSQVEYFQTAEFEESIFLSIYQSYAQTGTMEFFQDLHAYLQTIAE